MNHLYILLSVLNLILGVILTQTFFFLHRRRWLRWLRDFAFYFLFFNAYIVIDLISQYMILNRISLPGVWSFTVVVFFLALLLGSQYGQIHFLITGFVRLSGREPGKRMAVWYAGAILLSMAAHLVAVTLDIHHLRPHSVWRVYSYWIGTAYVLIIIFLVYQLIKGPSRGKNSSGLTGRDLNHIFLAAYLLCFGVYVLYFMFHIEVFWLNAAALLSINGPVLIWVRLSKKMILRSSDSEGDNLSSVLKDIMTEFGLTAREMNIIRELLAGRTNREIEDRLFISFSTVKNHIYNIYRKLGVKSRTQLVTFIRDFRSG